jgi:carboxylate-amine ligase
MAWGEAGGLFPGQDVWWEVRLHASFGTLEVRVPDTQTAPEDTAGVVAVVAGLVARLCERYDAGEPLRVHDLARINENRWRALRHGLRGELLDLDTGEPRPTRERVQELIEAVAPAAARLGGEAELEHARALARHNGAERQRALASERGVHGVVERMVELFTP